MAPAEESHARTTPAFDLPAPAERPHKTRQASRVLVVAGDEVLLFEDSDPGYADLRWWVTPGGGIDPGETPLQAAVREVAEETGFATTEDALIGPVAHRVVVHGYSDQILEQEEYFFVLQADRFEVSTEGHTEEELITLQSHRWWPLAELADTSAWIWPANLLQILDADPARPLELGRIEDESTLALDAQ